MSNDEAAGLVEPAKPVLSGDLGRRVTHRREELGVDVTEAATRADIHPGYLEHVENDPDVIVSTDMLLRLSRALETSVVTLLGGDVERPLGHGRALAHPHLDRLEENACRRFVSPGRVGRLVFDTDSGAEALPVNFAVIDGAIVFRTTVSMKR